jgi:hypothetical protein
MPEQTNGSDLFEIIKTTRSMRRLKPDPVPNDPKDPGGGCLCAKRRKYAAVAVPGHPRPQDQRDGESLVQARLG